MTRPRSLIRNTDYTTCPEGHVSNMQPCPVCLEEQIKRQAELLPDRAAAIVDALEREEQRQAWPQSQAITADEAALLAEAKKREYDAYMADRADERRDWQHIKGDLDI